MRSLQPVEARKNWDRYPGLPPLYAPIVKCISRFATDELLEVGILLGVPLYGGVDVKEAY